MAELSLRPYQEAAIQQLREGVKSGHRSQILCIPTGGGKTVVATHLLQEALRKQSPCAFVVDRVSLVDQTSAVLDSYGLSHGIVQADHWRRRPYELLQVCSAQTMEKRGFAPGCKLLVVDECHVIRQQTADLIANHPDLVVVGLSATPLTKGLGKLYSRIVNVTTAKALTAEKHLVPAKVYCAISPDMTGAKVMAGEWSSDEVEKRGTVIIGDIVREWAEKTALHFGGPVKTIAFSATIAHGAEMCKQFQAAGFNFQQLSYRDDPDESREKIATFRRPDSDIVGLVSCEVLGRGTDLPDVLCGIGARPYRKSLMSHIQQFGRVLRPSPGKECAVWLDHAGNFFRFYADHQEISENGIHTLDDGERDKPRKEPDEKVKEQLVCSCGALLSPDSDECPGCGKVRKRRSLVENISGEMIELGESAPKKGKPFMDNPERVWQQLCWFGNQRKHGDVVAAKRWATGQYFGLYNRWPRREFDATTARGIDFDLKNEVLRRIIAYAKRRQAA